MDFDIFFDAQNDHDLMSSSFLTYNQPVDQVKTDVAQAVYNGIDNQVNSAFDFLPPTDSGEHTISPMDAITFSSQNFLLTPMATPNYCAPLIHPCVENLEEFLAPLVSPAITPNYTEIHHFRDSPIQDQYFTPLSSPALAPNSNNTTFDNIYHDEQSNKSSSSQDASSLQQQLAQIEAKQQLLRDQIKTSPAISPSYKKSPLAMYSNSQQAPPSPIPSGVNKKRPSFRQQIVLASPQLQSSQHHISLPTVPATPASLMKMSHHPSSATVSSAIPSSQQEPDRAVVDLMPSLPPAAVGHNSADYGVSMTRSTSLPITASPTNALAAKKRKLAPSPRTLKPLLSPFLQPDPRANAPIVAANNLGIENRRSAHKVAEQRRRDTLKQSFDSLRKEITEVLVTEAKSQPTELPKSDEVIWEEKEKEVRFMSKVLLLQHSYEYILRLKNDSKQKDQKLSCMQEEIEKLKLLLESKS